MDSTDQPPNYEDVINENEKEEVQQSSRQRKISLEIASVVKMQKNNELSVASQLDRYAKERESDLWHFPRREDSGEEKYLYLCALAIIILTIVLIIGGVMKIDIITFIGCGVLILFCMCTTKCAKDDDGGHGKWLAFIGCLFGVTFIIVLWAQSAIYDRHYCTLVSYNIASCTYECKNNAPGKNDRCNGEGIRFTAHEYVNDDYTAYWTCGDIYACSSMDVNVTVEDVGGYSIGNTYECYIHYRTETFWFDGNDRWRAKTVRMRIIAYMFAGGAGVSCILGVILYLL